MSATLAWPIAIEDVRLPFFIEQTRLVFTGLSIGIITGGSCIPFIPRTEKWPATLNPIPKCPKQTTNRSSKCRTCGYLSGSREDIQSSRHGIHADRSCRRDHPPCGSPCSSILFTAAVRVFATTRVIQNFVLSRGCSGKGIVPQCRSHATTGDDRKRRDGGQLHIRWMPLSARYSRRYRIRRQCADSTADSAASTFATGQAGCSTPQQRMPRCIGKDAAR
ncbi:hypothetical protein LMG9673_04725 [Ralstonia pseudosolanacearum]|nr:hypothetical protein LMG9673_04725 [Ralstonia pseudosolanacearum]